MTVTGGAGGERASVPAGPEHQPGTLAPPGPEPATVASPRAPAAASLPLPWALAVALIGGLALTAAFPPIGIWPLAPAGPALLAVALWRRGLIRQRIEQGVGDDEGRFRVTLRHLGARVELIVDDGRRARQSLT